MTALEVLEGAHKLLLKTPHAWVQARYAAKWNPKIEACTTWYDGKPDCFCAMGALNHASGFYHNGPDGPMGGDHPAKNEAEGLLMEGADILGKGYIETWNDEPGRTRTEVLTAFRKAIKLARERTA